MRVRCVEPQNALYEPFIQRNEALQRIGKEGEFETRTKSSRISGNLWSKIKSTGSQLQNVKRKKRNKEQQPSKTSS